MVKGSCMESASASREQRARELDGGRRSGPIRTRFGKVAIGSAGLSVFIYVRQLLHLAYTYMYTQRLLYRAISDD